MFKYTNSNAANTTQKQSQRFKRVINQLNRSTELKGSQIGLKPASEISLFGGNSANSSQRSTKYTHTPTHSKKIDTNINEDLAIDILLENYQVIVNRTRTTIRTQFIPTSKGLKYIIILNDGTYVNLSWVHSAQQLQKNKILILYYTMEKIKRKQKPSIESMVIQFSHQLQLNNFLSAILFIHSKYHDEQVEKVYHQLCSS